MALEYAQPAGLAPQVGVNPQQVVEPRVLTPEEDAAVALLYEELKPLATETARDYVLNRTPAWAQEAMAALIEADWPAPPAA